MKNNPLWLLVTIFWTIVVGSFAWHESNNNLDNLMKQALLEAHTSYNKDLVYRRWVATHGGVYVPVSTQTPANPYLKNIPERDIETPSGRQLTLINPAYMTRQVQKLAEKQYGVKGHITSLKPLRPENKPDAWETKALQSFENGKTSAEAIENMEGQEFLRVMFPFITEASCLKCHSAQGYQVGDIRGGISVSVPLEPYLLVYRATLPKRIVYYVGLWLLGMLGVTWSRSKINLQLLKTESALEKSIKIEKMLRESEERFRALHDASFGGVIIHDKGVILDCNQGLSDMTGFTHEELVGMNGLKLIAQDSLELVVRNVKSGYTKRYEVEGIRKDGSLYPLSIKGKNVFYRGREARVIEFRDITERKQAEEVRDKLHIQLDERSKELEQIVYVTSHDLRTPLFSIEGFGGMLGVSYEKILSALEEEDLSVEARERLAPLMRDSKESIGYIRSGIASMNALLHGLLQFSRTGRIEVVKEDVDMNTLVTGIFKTFKIQLKERGITTEITELPSCMGDKRQIHQLFINLIGNAIKCSEQNKPQLIKISGQTDETHTVYCVEDNGIGIAQEYQGKIFEIFHQLNPELDGEGLGLSIVRRIMERHQGRVWVDSEPGRGSRFYVSFPKAR